MSQIFSLPGEPSLVTEARQHILESFSDLEFYPDGHRYVLNGRELPSVSNVVHRFVREPFDDQRQAIRYAQRHGQTPEYWIQQWRQNAFRAQTLGTKTHAYGESLGYLRAGMPERICPSILPQYMPEYNFLAPIHPKEEAVLRFMDDMPPSMHLVLNEARAYSGKNPCPELNIKQQLAGTFDMLYYTDGTNGKPAGFVILDYKTNAGLQNEYNRKYGRMLATPFADLTEEDCSIYALQLSLYALMLQDIGIPIISRCIVWLRDGEYELIPVPDLTPRLRQAL
ncbi:MAG: hypothetical protein IJ148_04670 [Bacteroidaceae bacterium]|nr:hypothetical protein [Bacteroidaceae bacterium]